VSVEVAGEAQFEDLLAKAEAAEALDADGLYATYPAGPREALSYDPTAAAHVDLVQGSALALTDAEMAVLGDQGLVISKRQVFSTFLRGYAAIYSEHLPVFVSADAILDTVHQSYDAILLSLESASLIPKLGDLLRGMKAQVAAGTASDEAKANVTLYLDVALALLNGEPGTGDAQPFVEKALAASGMETIDFMGGPRMIDFSQFTPRGHYTGSPELEQYFRAMIWLGRVDLRIVETLPNGSQVFNRGQFEMSVLVDELMNDANTSLFSDIESVVGTFVGESDYLTVPALAQLVADLGGTEGALAATDEQVAEVLATKGYGAQRIMSHLMVNDGTVKTLPLNRSFLLFGQRYIVDSHVFSETVYDRIGDRLMPSPLDAAFAALGNDDALEIQRPEYEGMTELPGALARMRTLIDAHGDDFWSENFYNLWLGSLRTLSARSDGDGLPAIARTEAWGKRLLNAQLGSWSQLRHDTLLYAKQSYTGIPGCAFPDAYVEPYPAFFAALETYAEQGAKFVVDDPTLQASISTYYDNLRTIAGHLKNMAQVERDGGTFTVEQMAFINDAVRIVQEDAVCTTIEAPDGWMADLFFERSDALEMDVTIADVHTQPADWSGAIVGKVLHVGTSLPRLMVTTIDTCEGPKAYAGMAYGYHEQITQDFERLTDEQWQTTVIDGSPADVPWMSSVLAE
jgi:hypothetical protein